MRKKQVQLFAGVVGVVMVVILANTFIERGETCRKSREIVTAAQPVVPVIKPKVLFLNSYHRGYLWCDELVDGLLKVFKGTLREDDTVDSTNSPVRLRIVHMDTKRNPSEEFKLQAAARAKAIIDDWQPDLIIFAEDNAAKYVIAPYYRDSDIPCVFCGVNWDASEYGFPCKNVTGMLEVDLLDKMVEVMQKYAKGPRLGVLGEDNESNRKATENYIGKLGMTFEKVVYVKNLEEWKAAYLDIQKEVDMLIVEPPCFLLSEGDEAIKAEAKKFVLENSTIPTGCVESPISPYALFCFSKSPSEHGEWTASTALRILNGTLPENIPVVKNERVILYLNMPLAKKRNYVFPAEMVEQAVLVE